MKSFFQKLIQRVEDTPLTLSGFILTFSALILTRLTIESALNHFTERSFFFIFFEFSHTFLFFLCSFLVLLPLARLAGATTLVRSSTILLLGFLVILTPPLIDSFVFGSGNYWSFYVFDSLRGLVQRFFTFFGDHPDMGITTGVRVEVFLVTLALAYYAFLKSQPWRRILLVALLSYASLFILGCFPSFLTFLILGLSKNIFAINSTDIAALFLTPETILGREITDFQSVLNFKMSIIYALMLVGLAFTYAYRYFSSEFLAFVRNARWPQMVYHAGLFSLGGLFALLFVEPSFRISVFAVLSFLVLLVAIECAWLASIVINDFFDTSIDRVTNLSRPLITGAITPDHYRILGVFFFLFSLFYAGIVSFSALLLLLAYQALSWLYSAPPLRLKQYPGLATLLAALAGILVLVTGFVSMTPTHNIKNLPLSLILYLFCAYFLVLPLKDFKDIEGDKKDGVATLPVLLGIDLTKHLLGSFTFLLFVFSPSLLNVRALFLPALFFGSLSFFVIEQGTDTPHPLFHYRSFHFVILFLTLLYGLTIVAYLH